MNDWQLLNRYAAARDQIAFAELVRRHVNLVYTTAARILGNNSIAADDVVQAVFLMLSQKASRIPQRGALAGWLYRTTTYCCRDAAKTDRRRKKHEREAAAMKTTRDDSPKASSGSVSDTDDLRMLLDAALEKLGEKERTAILVRYLEDKTVAETSVALNVSVGAAEKRLERALRKLRAAFARRGFTVPAATIVGVLVSESARAVPASIALHTLVNSTLAGSVPVAAVSIAKGAAIMMKIATAKITAAIVAVVLIFGASTAIIVERVVHADSAPTVPLGSSNAKGPPAAVPSADPPLNPETQAQVVTLIKKWGGTVKTEGDAPDGDVVEVNLMKTHGVTDGGIVHLENLPQLRSLTLIHTDITDEGLQHLKMLRQLHTLILSSTKVEDAGLQALADLPELQTLDLDYTKVTDVGLEHLKKLAHLQNLGLMGLKITDVGIKSLRELSQLQILSLDGDSGLTDAALPHLRGLALLESLSLSGARITDEGLKDLEGFSQLQTLRLDGTLVTGKGFTHLKKLSHLQCLGLAETVVTDSGLENLVGMDQLQTLYLGSCRELTDAGIAHLKRLTNLQNLGLENTRITDAGLESLSGLNQLQILNLSQTKVTDAGLKQIAEMKELHNLILTGASVTGPGVRRFSDSLPGCKITR